MPKSSDHDQDQTAAEPAAEQALSSSATPDQTPDPVPSSSAEGKSEPTSLMDAVQDVVPIEHDADEIDLNDFSGSDDQDGEGASPDPDPSKQSQSEESASKEGETSEDDDPEKGSDDLSEEDLSQFKPKAQKRVRRLLQERDAYRADAERIRVLDNFMDQHGLEPQDVKQLLEAGALLRRGDYEAFLRHVDPLTQTAQEALGQRLPQDIQEMLDNGEITENAAQELTRSRFAARRHQAAAERSQRTVQEQRQQGETQRRAEAMRTAIGTWEARTRAADPDYDAKADTVQRVVQGLVVQRGRPANEQDALAMVKEAYDTVSGLVTRAKPQVRPTRPTPTGGTSTRPASAEPKTLEEAAYLGLRQARAG